MVKSTGSLTSTSPEQEDTDRNLPRDVSSDPRCILSSLPRDWPGVITSRVKMREENGGQGRTVRLELITKTTVWFQHHHHPFTGLPKASSRWHCSHTYLFGSGELEAWLVLCLIQSWSLPGHLCRGQASVSIHLTT
jgi:hypothetical protein